MCWCFAASNAKVVLALTDEYQIDGKKAECEQILLSEYPSMELLVLAERHGLAKLNEKCVKHVGENMKLKDVEGYFNDLSKETVVEIVTGILHTVNNELETKTRKIKKVFEESNYTGYEHAEGCKERYPPLKCYQHKRRNFYSRRYWKVPCPICFMSLIRDIYNDTK